VSIKHWQEFEDVAYHCTVCHKCLSPCPVKIDFGDVSMNMRNLLRKMGQKTFRPGNAAAMFMLNATNPETIKLAPEALEVANCYLQLNDPRKVADELDLDVEVVTNMLKLREVKTYIDAVFMDSGYNNRFLMRRAMDALIKQKFQELEEAGTGSQKDISELLALSHKMSMDLLDKEIQLEKIRSGTAPQRQVNVQINEGLDGSKYSKLVQQLISGEGV
jgi:hypothetical protein